MKKTIKKLLILILFVGIGFNLNAGKKSQEKELAEINTKLVEEQRSKIKSLKDTIAIILETKDRERLQILLALRARQQRLERRQWLLLPLRERRELPALKIEIPITTIAQLEEIQSAIDEIRRKAAKPSVTTAYI